MAINTINQTALKIALVYLFIGCIWIILSDSFLAHSVTDVKALTTLQTYKGWFFVVVSGFIVYFIARYYIVKQLITSTRLTQSQAELIESKRIIDTLHKNLPGMVYRCSIDEYWTMHLVSEGCSGLTGYNSEEIFKNTHISFEEIIYEDDRAMVRHLVLQAISEKRAFQIEYRIVTKDNDIKWVCEQGSAILSENGEISKLEGYIFDITDKKHLEKELLEAQRLKHIGQAAATIIHDLKSPMQVIVGHNELLRMNETKKEYLKFFNIVDDQLDRMTAMCQEILDYAKGTISLSCSTLDVKEFISQLVTTYQPIFKNNYIELSCRFTHETDVSTHCTLDKDKMWRALMNIINNAKEAIPQGGKIKIQVDIHDTDIRIGISDNGSGIPKTLQTKIFDPYVTFGKNKGTGLGLAITKKIIESHNGTITFISNKNSGTTFTITLPKKVMEDQHQKAVVIL